MSRISELEEELLRHKQLYYYGSPEISDQDFDRLEEELRSLKLDSPVLQFVGHVVTGDSIRHDKPMLSLEKVKTVKDLKKWAGGESLLATDKVDGSACSLVYEQGLFKLAKTRGDGEFGEDITASVSHISFPRVIPDSLAFDISEVRGEICITKTNFKELQNEMQKRGLQAPESIRNCVAGLLHRKEHVDLCKYLTFIAYGISTDDRWYLKNNFEYSLFVTLLNLGFRTPVSYLIEDYSKIEDLLSKGPQESAYLTDGYVFAIDNLKNQLDRGFTNHHPKGKIAFKFASETAETEIKEIIVDVGRTGKLSFVADVIPVYLSGANISRVTLHNWKYVQGNVLGKDAIIEITRSNEVIPKHVRTIRSPGVMEKPERCPLCNSLLSLSDTGVDLYCISSECPAKAYGRLENWVKIVEIDNIGEETLKDLFESGKVSKVADFYKLTVDDLMELPRMGKRSSKKIFDNIQKTRSVPFDKFLAALGIDGLGKSVAKLIGEKYRSLDSICEELNDYYSFEKELMKIDGIGETLSKSISYGIWFYAFRTAQEIRQAGVEIADLVDPAETVLNGLTFVITGSLSKPRKVVEDLIKLKGGKVSSSVSAKTSYLVCNEVSGSSKSRKAQELGISIISEEKLYEMFDK